MKNRPVKVLDVMLLLAAIVAIVAAYVWYQYSGYWEGRNPIELAYRMSSAPLLCGCLALVGIICLLAVLCRIIMLWRHHGNRHRLTLVAMLVCTAAILTTILGTARPRCQYFLDGFREWVCEEADLAAIAKWAESPDLQDGLIPEAQWPQSVAKLGPQFVTFRRTDGPAIELAWGGAFLHWGLVVCADDIHHLDHKQHEHAVDLDNTACLWCD